MYDDNEATAFEMSPLGARQRMLPTRTFLSRLPPRVPASLQAPPMTTAPAQPMLVYPPEIHYPDAIDEIVASSPPSTSSAEWAALPSASTSMTSALPISSRRVRWIAVPLASMLLLIVLGGAMWQPHEVEAPSIAPGIASTDEDVQPASSWNAAAEDPPPVEEAPVANKSAPIAKPIAAKPAKRVSAKPRKVTVNSSTALGNLRPRKAW